MPEAIATTKRKFYKALDSLAHSPATRPTEPAAKRVRRSVSTTTSSVTGTALPAKAGDSGIATPKRAPNFSPWSHETFLARLKTFSSVSQWHPKPEAIGEVAWAKRGWACVDVNTVACAGGCEKRVVVSMSVEMSTVAGAAADVPDENDEAEEVEGDGEDESIFEHGLVQRYLLLIVEGHSDVCMWHRAGCKDDIYHLQVVRPDAWQPELKARYQSLQRMSSAIRDVTFKSLPHETASSLPPKKLITDFPPDLLGRSDVRSEDAAIALEIALHGWRGSHDSGTDLLHCNACFQRIGLWMYQPGYRPARTSSDDEDEDASIIDLVEMHREHCPWRNPDTQKASGSLTGLSASQILQRVISTCAREQRRKSQEAQKTAQQLEVEDNDAEVELEGASSPAPSMEEVARQDKDRESRLKKLKSLFTIKRRPTVKSVSTAKARHVQAHH
ncbi:hypothetical protein LTR53_014178 [Teratosphaeriaceae sp. CCFEE 6253]|nr:hypothetical protein LTR53_014178 [Teratosphaeriaceae sp. CCFEE 6253]